MFAHEKSGLVPEVPVCVPLGPTTRSSAAQSGLAESPNASVARINLPLFFNDFSFIG